MLWDMDVQKEPHSNVYYIYATNPSGNCIPSISAVVRSEGPVEATKEYRIIQYVIYAVNELESRRE